MITIDPQPGALQRARDALDPERPVVMVNLLSFNERANYEDGTQCSGLEAYKTYSSHTSKLVAGVGGDIVYVGYAHDMLIAPEEDQWDQVLLVRYPNFSAFLSMIKSQAYGEIVHHRTAALQNSRLYATHEARFPKV